MDMLADMNSPHPAATAPLAEYHSSVTLRLAGLWTSTMFCYAYADLIGFYAPGRIAATMAGDLGPLGQVTHPMLLAIAACMAIPALMVALSLLLPARLNRPAQLIFGVLYTLIMAATIPMAPPFYQLLGSIEVLLTLCIVWLAWRWPRAM